MRLRPTVSAVNKGALLQPVRVLEHHNVVVALGRREHWAELEASVEREVGQGGHYLHLLLVVCCGSENIRRFRF